MKPTVTAIHLVKILITTTNVNAIVTSIPCSVKKFVNDPSTTPIPNGKNDATPKIIDDVYVGIITRNSNSIPNANNIKNIAIHSSIQNNADKPLA